MPRVIKFDLRIDWGLDSSYTDESSRLVAANGKVALAAPESGISNPRGTVDQCTITLNNNDGRFSPLLTTGPLYSQIAGGGSYHAPMYLRVSIDNGTSYSRVFTGVIKIPKEGPPYPGVAATVEIDCRSRDEILLNKRLSTPINTFRTLHDDGAGEANVILSWLTQAGIPVGECALDPSLFVLPWAWMDDESPVEDIWQIAAAAGGRFYCDQDGTFRYENMTHWLQPPHNTSQETIDESGYGRMAGPTYDDRELYNGVTVVASPRATLQSGTLWSADSVVVVPANGSISMVAKLRQPAYQIDGVEFTAVSGGGSNLNGNIGVSMTQYAQRVILNISNSHAGYSAELVTLSIVGIPVSGAPSIDESRTSSAAYWTSYAAVRPGRVKLLRGNAYVQTREQAATLAEFLRDRYELPRLSWQLQDVPGDPTRRLGDRMTVGGVTMSSDRDAFVIGISFRLSNSGFVQDLDLIDAGSASDGTGLFPYDSYFVLDANHMDVGGDNAPIFY
jgi:hypothetical protein